MNHQDLINTCVFEQIQGLLFSDLSGPLRIDHILVSLYMHANYFINYFTKSTSFEF